MGSVLMRWPWFPGNRAGNYLVWDATYWYVSQSHCLRTATEPGGAAAYAEEKKAKKYAHLDLFQPVALETRSTMGSKSRDFYKGAWPMSQDGYWGSTVMYLLQRISIAIQVRNAASVIASFPNSVNVDIILDLWLFCFSICMHMCTHLGCNVLLYSTI